MLIQILRSGDLHNKKSQVYLYLNVFTGLIKYCKPMIFFCKKTYSILYFNDKNRDNQKIIYLQNISFLYYITLSSRE